MASYSTPQSYVSGLVPAAVWVGASIVGVGIIAALFIPAHLGLARNPNVVTEAYLLEPDPAALELDPAR